MGQGIIKLGGKYLIWSTITDSPISNGMTREELEEEVKAERGDAGLRELGARLERVEAKGTSFHNDASVDETIGGNRAGPKETEATKEQIIKRYCK